MLYRGMDRAQLDAAYNNSAAVPERDAIVADWAARSTKVRREYAGHLDLPGQSVRHCAELMRAAVVPSAVPPSITDGARFVMRDVPGEPRLICADSVGMLQPDDAGQIAVTASHGALSGGRPDNAIPEGIYAVFFSDAGGGMDGAGIARLPDLDRKGIVAGTTSADSAPIGDSRALYRDGILSHVNGAAMRLGGRVGMPLKEFVDVLIAASKR